ncbi:MAG: cell division protein ZapA [Flavobacterium sp. BFFFF2]|nr:MAG: cell division protein ZapA [Flavobacterium sp. BFFFF2]
MDRVMEKLKIKLNVADRVYPLTVDPAQEEGLRNATRKIEQMIKQFESNYAVRDKQDVLAMCALQFASQLEQKQLDTVTMSQEHIDKLTDLNTMLQDFLHKEDRSL